VTGGPITTTGTLAFGLSGSALPITSGGTGQTSVGVVGTTLYSNGVDLFYSNIDYVVYPPPVISGATNLIAAALIGRLIFQTGAAVNFALTMPTAAAVIALVGNTTDTFTFCKLIQTTTARQITIVTNTGVTLQDNRATNAAISQYILTRVTSATTITIIFTTT
jgi:hypothetical protein